MKFADVIGHSDVKKRLIHSAKENRVSHALLFLGPEGTGGLPMAIAYAQYLVCEHPTDDDSCGRSRFLLLRRKKSKSPKVLISLNSGEKR